MRFGSLRSSRRAKALALLAWVLLLVASIVSPNVVATAAECCRAGQGLAAATRDDCSADEKGEPSASDTPDDCPCPLPCALACRAHVQSTLPGPALPALPSQLHEKGSAPPLDQRPSGPEPGDILHVPKTLRS